MPNRAPENRSTLPARIAAPRGRSGLVDRHLALVNARAVRQSASSAATPRKAIAPSTFLEHVGEVLRAHDRVREPLRTPPPGNVPATVFDQRYRTRIVYRRRRSRRSR